ncbi:MULTISPECIES: hypothetical protein [Acetobacteraceae]|mgnify:CR=1 FL=1|uniref:Uncharacterized protein n=2 Tax=Acetobacteraceae TaxID=433 RepID=A0A347WCA1_9PROT|nr:MULTISPECIES: hypothetical protein [Acetobacteraceae]AXY22494.1 hypothetical protein CD178_01731 [Komagataeibacter saccharivorans]MBL7237191.1 hypothetical protein [Novacetimonas hansenii]MCJ8355570.1 hypothetical protein [Novacetimonas hansenii]PMP98268.1 hypothetical protein S101450_00045 [Komagataeibacter saccharivorans]PYD52168.1 hypothetical protein CFR79_01585 [Komagataeibacter saccharivorans]
MFESSVIEVDGVFVGIVFQNGPDEPYNFRAMHERVTQMDGDMLPTFEAAVAQARARFRIGRCKAPRVMEMARLRA